MDHLSLGIRMNSVVVLYLQKNYIKTNFLVKSKGKFLVVRKLES